MRLQDVLTAAKGELHGTLSPGRANLHGTLSAGTVIGVELYEGAYTVHSEAHEVQILPTANKQLTKNITVEKIPIWVILIKIDRIMTRVTEIYSVIVFIGVALAPKLSTLEIIGCACTCLKVLSSNTASNCTAC